jgi:Protein of unknown function (DUF1499)
VTRQYGAGPGGGRRRIARGTAIGLLGALTALVAAGCALRLYLARPAENHLRPGENIAIGDLRGPLPANAFVACPPGYCAIAGAMPSPIFATAVAPLYREFGRLIASAPRTVTILARPPRRIVVIQRSAIFRFPDIVTAEFVALGADRSSLALYSRARYGSYDFGVNRRRVAAWLARLRRALPHQ